MIFPQHISNDTTTDWGEELRGIDLHAEIAKVEERLEKLLEYSKSKIECHIDAGRFIDSYKVR